MLTRGHRTLGSVKIITAFMIAVIFSLGFFAPEANAQSTNTLIQHEPLDITNDIYSVKEDLSGQFGDPVCKYKDIGGGERALFVDKEVLNTKGILMGVSDHRECPMPGKFLFKDAEGNTLPGIPAYMEKTRVTAEFLLSGVVCVVQAIILDSMFKVYCVILLWFYQIIWSAAVLYVMLYGLAIMFDLTNEPVQQAPKRILKLVFIFFLAANAQWGFYWIFQGFTNILESVSNIAVKAQPLYTERGEISYDNEGFLLDENGNRWRPVKNGVTTYKYFDITYGSMGNKYDSFGRTNGVKNTLGVNLSRSFTLVDLNGAADFADAYGIYLKIYNPEFFERELYISTDKKIYEYFSWSGLWQEYGSHLIEEGRPNGLSANKLTPNEMFYAGINRDSKHPENINSVEMVEPQDYVQFRVPKQQWMFAQKTSGTGTLQHFLVPVFDELHYLQPPTPDPSTLYDPVTKGEFCIKDYKFDFNQDKLLEEPHCSSKDVPLLPLFAPYKVYCFMGGPGGVGAACTPGQATIIFPPRLKQEFGTSADLVCTAPFASRNTDCWCADEKECRMPFQGILGRLDALFTAIVGEGQARGINAVALALLFYVAGGSFFLGMFLMTGVLTMFTSFIQIIWVYVTAVMMLVFLMMLSPIFLSFALFGFTEKLFKAYISNLISYAIQPIIVIGFLIFFSYLTNIDTISKFAEEEVSTVTYSYYDENGKPSMQIKAPGFVEPLYAMPWDFQSNYKTIVGVDATGAALYSDTNDVNKSKIVKEFEEGDAKKFINSEQRKDYRKRKEAELVTAYSIALECEWLTSGGAAGSGCNGISTAYKGTASTTNKYGTTDHSLTEGEQQIINHLKLLNSGGFLESISRNGSGANSFITTAYGTDGEVYNNIEKANNPKYNPFLEWYRKELGVEDTDALTGEIWGDSATKKKGELGEYPVCAQHCPRFEPPYIGAGPNQGINVPRTVNGDKFYNPVTTVPYTSNPDPDQSTCKVGCMNMFQGTAEKYKRIWSAVFVWLMINAITGAFMTQVPEIARRLSSWSPEVRPAAIFNSEKFDSLDAKVQRGGTQNIDGVYSMGSMFDGGLVSGRMGAVPATFDAMRRYGDGKIITEVDLKNEKIDGQFNPSILQSRTGIQVSQENKVAAAAINLSKRFKGNSDLEKILVDNNISAGGGNLAERINKLLTQITRNSSSSDAEEIRKLLSDKLSDINPTQADRLMAIINAIEKRKQESKNKK